MTPVKKLPIQPPTMNGSMERMSRFIFHLPPPWLRRQKTEGRFSYLLRRGSTPWVFDCDHTHLWHRILIIYHPIGRRSSDVELGAAVLGAPVALEDQPG